jgi:peptidyl-prolyl cis-trans isomerase C
MKYSVLLFLSVAALAGGLFAQNPPASGQPPAPPAGVTPDPGLPPAAVPAPGAPATPAAPPAVAPDKVVLSIGDESITAAEFDGILQSLPEQVRSQAQGPAKRQMAEQIVRLKLLAAEARKRGLDKDEVLQTRIQFQEENLLAGAVYNKLAEEAPVTEESLRTAYEERKKDFETVQARHILVKFKGSPVPNREGQAELTEEQALTKAQELRKQLEGGADFAELAKKESDDTGSGSAGGDLGTFGHGQMVPAFEEAAFNMPAGELSQPIKTQFGYHLIKVEKKDTKAFEEVKQQLETQARPTAAREAIEQMRKDAAVTIDDVYFGPDPQKVAGAAAAAGTATK